MSTRGATPGTGQVSWPSFLRGEDAHEIHAHISNGDPLRVRERSARRLRQTWFLLDPDRVYLRALGTCALAAVQDEPTADLEAWTIRNIDRAIEQLVRADAEAERNNPGILTDEERNFPLLTESLMLDPEIVRTVSVAFNALEPLPRRAFYELMIEGLPVGDCIEKGPWDEDGLYAAIQTALATVGLSIEAQGDGDPRRRKQR